eukprot:751907-Hanusia_phi.AAC.1
MIAPLGPEAEMVGKLKPRNLERRDVRKNKKLVAFEMSWSRNMAHSQRQNTSYRIVSHHFVVSHVSPQQLILAVSLSSVSPLLFTPQLLCTIGNSDLVQILPFLHRLLQPAEKLRHRHSVAQMGILHSSLLCSVLHRPANL